MTTKIAIELKLSDEDRNAIITEVEARLKGVAEAAVKGAGKAKPAASGKGAAKKEEPADESGDDFEDTDGDGDAEGEGEGEGDDDFDGDGEAEAKVTKNDVQAALRDYAAVSSKNEAMKLLETAGKAKGLSALEEKNFAAVIKAANEATAKAKKAAKKK
ncbi:hypothetical protein JQ608_06790 [Bradyrhizobium liaoningense]|uniref:hypothetical protein n=1 Tax=Bradyrhizobium liaoningense TaxID=43992 RepID=UPI001BACEE2B|nr:hypothetical protein [Bradyrhizobium liaoningense]MBR0876908.1 hypothetical protein [Bradyrhizobium liaoningense]